MAKARMGVVDRITINADKEYVAVILVEDVEPPVEYTVPTSILPNNIEEGERVIIERSILRTKISKLMRALQRG